MSSASRGEPVTETALLKRTSAVSTSPAFRKAPTMSVALARPTSSTVGAVRSTVTAISLDSLALPASSLTTARKR